MGIGMAALGGIVLAVWALTWALDRAVIRAGATPSKRYSGRSFPATWAIAGGALLLAGIFVHYCLPRLPTQRNPMGVAMAVLGVGMLAVWVLTVAIDRELIRKGITPRERRGGAAFLTGWAITGMALLFAGVIVHLYVPHLLIRRKPPVVSVRKMINMGGARSITYSVAYNDGSGDTDMYADIEPFGEMNELHRRRDGREFRLVNNEPGAVRFSNVPAREQATPEVLQQFHDLQEAVGKELTVEALRWLDARDRERSSQENDRIKKSGRVVVHGLAKPPPPWDNGSSQQSVGSDG